MTTPPVPPRRAALLVGGAFAATVLIGGFSFIAVKFTVLELDPLWGAALRFAGAAALLALYALLRGLPWPRAKALTGTLWFGLLQFGAAMAIGVHMARILPARASGLVVAAFAVSAVSRMPFSAALIVGIVALVVAMMPVAVTMWKAGRARAPVDGN